MKKIKWESAKAELKTDKVIFLEFSTTWCGDCKMMQPIVNELEAKLSGSNIEFIEVDAEEANLLRKDEEFNVSKVPAFYVVKGNKKQFLGFEYQPLELLEAKAKEFLKSA